MHAIVANEFCKQSNFRKFQLLVITNCSKNRIASMIINGVTIGWHFLKIEKKTFLFYQTVN